MSLSCVSSTEDKKDTNECNRGNSETNEASRGDILSSNGEILSTTTSKCNLYLDLGKNHEGDISDSLLFASLDKMAEMVSMSVGKHDKEYYINRISQERSKKHPSRCFRVEAEKIPYSVWLSITRLPGWKNCVVREVDHRSVVFDVRDHIYGDMALNIIGLENRYGKYTGLEGAYDSILKDHSIVATIDTRVQNAAEDALRQALAEYGGAAGCAIVMEVETGYVVACANLARSVDKNGKVEYREIRDWNLAVSGRYYPGSTMKAVVMTAMLNDPKIHIDTAMKVPVVKKIFPNSKKAIGDIHPNGDSLSVRRVIEKSSNPGMAELGWMYYRDRRDDLVALMKQVFPYEILHLDLRTPENNYLLNDVHRSTDDFLRLTYGYSTSVSPMQIITFYNALAGGGRMVKPLFCRAIIDRNGKKHEMSPVVMRERAFSRESARIMTEMLEGVVNSGTARRAIKDNIYHIAGKTGTAETVGNQNNASFAGFFPAENPRYTCYVMLEKIPYEDYGTQAAEVFRMISDYVMSIDKK